MEDSQGLKQEEVTGKIGGLGCMLGKEQYGGKKKSYSDESKCGEKILALLKSKTEQNFTHFKSLGLALEICCACKPARTGSAQSLSMVDVVFYLN